ncbi:MAG: hypothetical protein NTY10_06320 [Candidatus Omnitrophica bacterium]|nr:hypothetical protein [Candidatus Omnitrophota bacterium]
MGKKLTSLTVRPYQLMCLACRIGAGCTNDMKNDRLNEILKKIRANPALPVTLRCNVDSVYQYQNPGREDDTPGGELFNDKRDLDILQKLGLVPGATRPALDILDRLFEVVTVTEGICGDPASASAAWKGCPETKSGNYEKGRAQGVAAIIAPRSEKVKARAKQKSVEAMYRADKLFIRPHHLMCMACFHGGRKKLAPIVEDNLFEAIDIIQKNPEIPVELVAGCCMICTPCFLYHPASNRCIGGRSMGLRDQKKDLDVLRKTGLRYGDVMPARKLYSILFDRIKVTTEICGCGDGIERSPEWRICGGKEGHPGYVKARKKGLGIKRRDAH